MALAAAFFLGNNISNNDWQLLSDTRESWSRGKWINGSQDIEYDLFFPCSHPIVGACRRYERYKRTIPEYKWLPNIQEHNNSTKNGVNQSSTATYSMNLLCRTLGGKKLFLVGDSLTEHWWVYFALTATKNQRIVQECMDNEDNSHFVRIDCADYGIVKLYYIRNDPLWVTNPTPNISTNKTYGEIEGSMRHIYFNRDWINAIYNDSNTVLILNRGAHYTPDTELMQDIGHLFTYLTKRYPTISIVWRNTPAGHPNCQNFDTPLLVPPDLTFDRGSIPDNSTGGSTHRYHWNLFAHQNQLVKTFLENNFPSTLFLDVATPTNLRPDHHVSDTDCLHYCPHSVHDFWVLLLLNAFDHVINVTEATIHLRPPTALIKKIQFFPPTTFLNTTCPRGDLLILRRPQIQQPPEQLPQVPSPSPSLPPQRPQQERQTYRDDVNFLFRGIYFLALLFLVVAMCRQSSYFLPLYLRNYCCFQSRNDR